ncbi:carboxylesterase family protein [Caballeronia mineralivorans]|uniref:carboxylesterase family protein n=1 Tax=Caballeronia mineralivorans TaxID=2010198 RepID=UPI00094F66AA|nr:carboxylesterase family protein [Caballeronia mineralivorans]
MLWLKSKTLLCGTAFSITAAVLTACGGNNVTPDISSTPLDNHVTIASGSLAGNPADASGIVSFEAIPYAAALVGNLRWKEPPPVQAWRGVRDATKPGARCWAAFTFSERRDIAGCSKSESPHGRCRGFA